jgi:hypothetical protein
LPSVFNVRRCFFSTLADHGDEGSADVVAPPWVELIAALPDPQSAPVTAVWIQAVGEEYGEALEVTDAAENAVRALACLCRHALKNRYDVVYAWYL